MAHSTGKTDR